MGLLTGKTALITGAARGIGKAIALKFAEEGANVAFTDLVIDENGLATQEEIAAKGVKAKGYASNAADFAQTEEVVKLIKEEFGSISGTKISLGLTSSSLPVEHEHMPAIMMARHAIFIVSLYIFLHIIINEL